VVGPQGESIWTDKYGRVKVKFHWDRHAKGDDTSSCWVRVSSAWAGQGFGGVQIPRVNDEVVIDFINGDPDRPMVTGRVYNESSMPPWALPAAATQMGFMTRSKDGTKDNASYLFFEDKLGSETLDMHAEKDMKISVENDKVVTVDGNRTTEIKKEQKDAVTGNATFDYHAQRTTTVDKLETKTFNDGEKTTITNGRVLDITSGGDKITVKGDKTTTVDGNEEHHVTGKITEKYDSGQDTTVEVGGFSQNIKAGGINQTVKDGLTVNVNSGNWIQNVNDGVVNIYSPHDITIRSGSKIIMDAPEQLATAKGKNISFTGLSASFNAASVSVNGISTSWTPLTISTSLTSIVTAPMNQTRSLFKFEQAAQNLTIGFLHLFM